MAATLEQMKLQEITTQEIERYLSTHPDIVGKDDCQRDYEMAITNLIVNIENLLENDARKNSDEQDAELVRKAIGPLFEGCLNESSELAYAAYIALCSFYRRRALAENLSELLDAAPKSYKGKPMHQFIRLMCNKMLNPNDLTLLDEADRLCEPSVMGTNFGVEHCYAEYVADACENNEARVPYFMTEYMQKAVDRVESAIKKSKEKNNGKAYPKFYVTRARLLNIKAIYGDPETHDALFEQSQNDIRLALTGEKSKSKQTDYQLIGVRLQSLYYQKTLRQSIKRQEEALDKQIQENNVKNLEFLSFFSAIIGLLIAGTQLMMGMKFAEGATLLVALTGCLITAFGAIGFVLHGCSKRWIVNTIIVLLGIVLTVFAMIYGGMYAI